jgi:hypothetical protein
MNNNAHSQREDNEAHSLLSQAALLLDESRALSYAVVMALAQTPREELSREEIDALCQLAYELHNKLTKTQELFQEARQKLQLIMQMTLTSIGLYNEPTGAWLPSILL